MLILVRHGPPFRRWHRRLGDRLVAIGHRVRYEPAGAAAGLGLLAIERRIYRVAADWMEEQPSPSHSEVWAPELTVALAESQQAGGLVVWPEFNGRPGEKAMLSSARAGSAPLISVRGGASDAVLASGRPAIEDPYVLCRALQDLLPRLVTLLVQAVMRVNGAEALPPPSLDGDDEAPRDRSTAAFFARGLRYKVGRRFGPAQGRPEHWRLALRRVREPAYTLLADDPAQFRADPFLFEEAGRSWLFYEEYPYATGKGVIGRLAIGSEALTSSDAGDLNPLDGPPPDGRGEPRVVLEEGFHLSYPLVLRHERAIYMLPECSAAGRVQLYRADPFPNRWVPDVVLLEGRRLADATPVFHEGRWWLFATANEDGGSSWDQLHLFYAPDLLGPWTPHAGNPVLINAGAARPAGSMWHEDGVLIRPAQDCRTGYGVGLAICRVDRLDEGGYRQSLVRRVKPPSGLGATGLHTLNRAADWEVMDLKVPHPS